MQQWWGGLLEKAQQAAPVLFSTASGSEPAGYQPPGSANEFVFSPEKAGHATACETSDFGSPPRHERRGEASYGGYDRSASFATDVDGGYTGRDDFHSFGPGFGARGGSLPRMEAVGFSPQRPAGPPVAAEIDESLVTTPNGIGVPQGMCATLRAADIDTGDPYDSYRGNANPEGPYEAVPPTTLNLQDPPENYGRPPVPYPAVTHGESCRPPPSPYAACGGFAPPELQSGYSPPGTMALGGSSSLPTEQQCGQAHGSSMPSGPSSHQCETSAGDARQRETWEPGSIVEVYSSSVGSWNVANVIKVAAGEKGDVLTVQFVSVDGSKQKSLWRSDRHIVPLGSRSGTPELPPGFQMRVSERSGRQVFLDATTGKKYASLELAWSMHFERLAKNNPSGLEMTVAGPQLRRLQEQSQASEPLDTLGDSFSLGHGPPAQQGPSGHRPHSHLPTEGALVPSCRSEPQGRPPAISLAELMNMKAVNALSQPGERGHAGPSGMSHHSPAPQPDEWDSASPAGPSAMSHHFQAPQSAGHSPPAMPMASYGPMPTIGSKIALPTFGDRAPRDSQAAYLQHLADPGRADPGLAQATAKPFAERSIVATQGSGGDPYSSMHGFNPGQPPSVPRRPQPPPPPVHQGCPEMQAWSDDPFSQWRR